MFVSQVEDIFERKRGFVIRVEFNDFSKRIFTLEAAKELQKKLEETIKQLEE